MASADTARGALEPLYAQDGARFVPAALTRGPWDPGAQHGGAPSALLARALETMDELDGKVIVRVGYEFLRPVPLEPLTLERHVVGAGRRVTRLRAALHAGRSEVCRAEALCVRRLPRGERLATWREPAPPPGTRRLGSPGSGTELSFAGDAMEIQAVRGSFREPGPATAWFALRVPVVAGETPTPLQRLVAAADFANGVSAVLDWNLHGFVNADLHVHVECEPQGEWICLEAVTRVGSTGAAVSESVLSDRSGRVGRGVQTLLIEPRIG